MTDITPEIISAFRTQYAAFSDTVKYPNDLIQSALYEADAETGGKGWGTYGDDPRNFKRRGMFLYAAHWVAVMHPAGVSSMAGGARWAVSSKSVGDESTSYQTGKMAQAEAGDLWLSSTQFGQQWLQLRKRAGMGARAV